MSDFTSTILLMRAMARGQVTVYIDKDWYKRLQELVASKPSSRELDELIKKRVLELEGEGVELENTIDYEAAKKDHLKLVKEIDRFQSLLRKHDAYAKLEDGMDLPETLTPS